MGSNQSYHHAALVAMAVPYNGKPMDRKQIDKMIAVALSPGAYEKEAIAALMKARAVVQKPKVPSAPKPDHSIQYTVSHVTMDWLSVLLSSLSEQAYGLGLKSKFSCDYSNTGQGVTVNIRCDGLEAGCDAFVSHLNWLLTHINSELAKK
jgi:hypothetical protein